MNSSTSRSAASTRSIAQAVTSILANEGWGALNANAVAREAHCAIATVRSRGTTPVELARLAWDSYIAASVQRDVTLVVDGARSLTRTGQVEPLVASWQRLTARTVERDAGAELLVVANTSQEVASFVDPALNVLTTPENSDDPAACLRVTAALGIGAGLVLTNRHPWAQDAGLRSALTTRAGTFTRIGDVPPLPTDVDEYLTEVETLVEGDPALNELLRVTVELIGEFGADDITVKQIAARAGATEGLVFSRYPAKIALIGEALHRHSEKMWESMAETGRRTGIQYGPAVAGAAYDVQFLRPERAALRAINLEQARVSWHHTSLLVQAIERITTFRKSVGAVPGWAHLQGDLDFFLDFVSGIGLMLVARFVPHASTLPWLAITSARASELVDRGTQATR